MTIGMFAKVLAVEAGEIVSRLGHKALEAARLPELAGAGVGGVDRHLRREQHRVDTRLRNLLRDQLAVAHVALQRRAIAMEEHHDDARLAQLETLGDVHEHAVVVIGLVLPVDLSRIAAVAAAVALGDIEEGCFRSRVVTEIGEGR
jgi:hypothetical protein